MRTFSRRATAASAAVVAILTLGTTFTTTAGATVTRAPLANSQTPPAPTTTAPAPPAPIVFHYLALTGPDYREGDVGGDIWAMQITLYFRGFFFQEAPAIFGASTRHALTAFQKAYGLPRTGKLDRITRFALGATLDRPAPTFPKSGKAVEVSIPRQILIASENGVTSGIYDISSGKSSTPTPRGSFRIQRQINGQRISALGSLWRPKYFTGGYALHGSPSVPTYPASHGCVRLTNQEINYIWDANIAPIGTAVTIY